MTTAASQPGSRPLPDLVELAGVVDTSAATRTADDPQIKSMVDAVRGFVTDEPQGVLVYTESLRIAGRGDLWRSAFQSGPIATVWYRAMPVTGGVIDVVGSSAKVRVSSDSGRQVRLWIRPGGIQGASTAMADGSILTVMLVPLAAQNLGPQAGNVGLSQTAAAVTAVANALEGHR